MEFGITGSSALFDQRRKPSNVEEHHVERRVGRAERQSNQFKHPMLHRRTELARSRYVGHHLQRIVGRTVGEGARAPRQSLYGAKGAQPTCDSGEPFIASM